MRRHALSPRRFGRHDGITHSGEVSEEFPPASSSSSTVDKPQTSPVSTGDVTLPTTGSFAVVDPTGPLSEPLPVVHEAPPSKEGVGTFLMRKAKDAVRSGEAPTWGLDLREINDGIEHARSRSVIDLAMRIAESTLATGASAADVTANVLAVTGAYGLRSVHIDVTFTSIAVTHHRGAHQDPVTMVRTVRTRVTDFDRLAATHRLIEDISDGDLPLDEARRRFFSIMERPRLYRGWITTVSVLLLGGGVAALIGGRPLEILLAMIISALVDQALAWTGRRRLAAFFGQMVGGAIPTIAAMSIVALSANHPSLGSEVRPSVLVGTGIVVLLAGMSVVGAAQDAIDGYYVTAGARSFEVIVLTFGILVGVLGIITFASRLGVPSYLIPPSSLAPSVGVQLVAVACIAVSFGLGGYAGPRTILISVVTSLLGWLVYVIFVQAEFDGISSTAFACTFVGFVAQPLAWLFRVPSLPISTAGILAFLPGSMVYRGLYYLVEPAPVTTPTTDGPSLLFAAISTGLAIAGGVSLGSYFGRQVRIGTSATRVRASNRALRRSSPPVD